MTGIISSDRVRFGPYEVDLHTHELWKHGTKLKLAGQPFEILAVLIRRPGQLVTREELRSQLWPGDTFVDFNHGLNAAVNKLRDALCDSAEDPRYIETLPRRGYRFVGEVDGVEFIPPFTAEAKRAGDSGSISLGSQQNGGSGESHPALAPSFAVIGDSGDRHSSDGWRNWVKYGPVAGALLVFLMGAIWSTRKVEDLIARRLEQQQKEAAEKERRGLLFPLANLADSTSDGAFSPDGNQMAFRREGSTPQSSGIFVKPIHSAQIVQLTDDASDCCPVWSPDGRSIAFSRVAGREREVYSVPAAGGVVRKLYAGIASRQRDLDWSPDGSTITFAAESRQGASSIFALSLKDLSTRPITEPPPQNHDWGAKFSPDGQTLAFVRRHETGLPESVMIMPAGGGESRVVVNFYNGILGPPVWTADGQSLVFAAGTEPGLLRVPAFGDADVKDIDIGGMPAWHPTVAGKGNRLAFQMSSRAVSVWETNLGDGKLDSRRVVATDVGRNEGARVSPDGSKLVFMSNRSGAMEIWVSDRDGTNPIRLTWLGGVGTPRWSPDGRKIAFDVTIKGHGSVFMVDLDGGAPARAVMQDDSENLVPNWSEDGRWIYFASNRTGIWQVWKVPSAGGNPVQVTSHGGFAAYEVNGIVYYSKFNMPSPEVWQIPVGGGMESRVSPLVRPGTWASWAPVSGGICFVQEGANGEPKVMLFESERGTIRQLGQLPGIPFWLSATPDGRSVLYEHLDQENSHIMVLNNFH